ncbi:MAG TPA: class I SAM-dependent methyltransferase [Candidatus Limnocylindria bacterium]|nr:class I SAM-dependent methyltransferase [Candidatus Limnocylindria bacterium]
MSGRSIGLSEELHAYLMRVGVREPADLARLREDTAGHPQASMQIAPEEGALLAMLVRLIGAERILEIGTFTGYSSTAMALALPPGGRIVCCDISEEYTARARQAWAEAGVEDRVELRIGPAIETLAALEGEGASFDLAFIDADKPGYLDYYDACVRLVRPGGLVCLDNVLWSGRVADPDDTDPATEAIRTVNALIAVDPRVDVAMVPIADGLTLARVR